MRKPTESPPLCPSHEKWSLFLDIDGTLLALAERPQEAFVPPGLPSLIAAVTDMFEGAVALVSGRDLDDIDRLFSPYRFDAAGTHGFQWRLAGRVDPLAVRDDPVMAEVIKDVEEQILEIPGLELERKACSFALHHSQASDGFMDAWALAVLAKKRLGADYRLIKGKEVVEVMPYAAGKGKAIARYQQYRPYLDRIPIFVGDDITDEDGFETVNHLRGKSIRVGTERATEAQYYLQTPSDTLRWLEALLKSGGAH